MNTIFTFSNFSDRNQQFCRQDFASCKFNINNANQYQFTLRTFQEFRKFVTGHYHPIDTDNRQQPMTEKDEHEMNKRI